MVWTKRTKVLTIPHAIPLDVVRRVRIPLVRGEMKRVFRTILSSSLQTCPKISKWTLFKSSWSLTRTPTTRRIRQNISSKSWTRNSAVCGTLCMLSGNTGTLWATNPNIRSIFDLEETSFYCGALLVTEACAKRSTKIMKMDNCSFNYCYY